MSEEILLAIFFWMSTGHMITLCAMEFLDVKPRWSQIIIAYLVGPFAINKKWWLS